MRVIAGTARSLPLKTPKGMDTRPTTDRIKETLFNILQPRLADSVFVDLFSGSGAIGIEALSRGAKRAYFVECDAQATACIRDNLTFTGLTEGATVLKSDVFGALHQISDREADVIFMDPPYGQDYEKRVLEILSQKSYLTEETLIAIEASLDTDFSWLETLGFAMVKQKKYKTNQHVFVQKRQFSERQDIVQ